jgi:hypothetical protein
MRILWGLEQGLCKAMTLPGSGTRENGEVVQLHPSALGRTDSAEEQGVVVLTACPASCLKERVYGVVAD